MVPPRSGAWCRPRMLLARGALLPFPLVGCSIEDASGNPDAAIFELSHATERIAAAAAAARALPFPFTLTGRTENFLRGRPDLDDTIKLEGLRGSGGADGAGPAESRSGTRGVRGGQKAVQLQNRMQAATA